MVIGLSRRNQSCKERICGARSGGGVGEGRTGTGGSSMGGGSGVVVIGGSAVDMVEMITGLSQRDRSYKERKPTAREAVEGG